MDATGDGTSLDPATVRLILKLVSEVHGEDSTAALMKTLHDKYPGSCGDMPGEDEADEMQEDDDYSPAGQFRKAAQDQPPPSPPAFPGRPTPGGKMVAQDAAIRLHRAERFIKTADDFARAFPEANRIGLL